ncbi:MAG: HIT domain-containing protein [Candidatus Omnitrophica bacterium]|nr:HIT domain-containing protein [Candidatus Omnitrophota bacterium]
MKSEIIWAPWRLGYILGVKKRGCFLCQTVRGSSSKKNFLIFQRQLSFITLNIFPYNNGHLMVAPKRHVADFEDLTEKEVCELTGLVQLSIKVLRKAVAPHGFNVGLNQGRCAGAGLASHLHVHVVPRWEGDTNFMPVIAHTKVIPQSLLEIKDTLRKLFQDLTSSKKQVSNRTKRKKI